MKKDNATSHTLEIMDSRDSIPFRRSNRYIAGSINGALLLEQIVYWYAKMGQKPFYKIKEPCDSPQYKIGQSWCEELGFSSREFDTAIKLIGQKISKKITRDENILVHYWVDFRRLTFYEINMELYSKLKNEYYEKELIRLGCIDNEQTRKCGKRSYDHRKCGKRIYVNAESAFSVNAESASGYIRDYITEITHVCVENPENPENTEPTKHTHTEESLKQKLTTNPECLDLFNSKFIDYKITIEELADNCIGHYESKNKKPTVNQFLTWITKEREDNYNKKEIQLKQKHQDKHGLTEDEIDIAGRFKHAINMKKVDEWFGDPVKYKRGKELCEIVYNVKL